MRFNILVASMATGALGASIGSTLVNAAMPTIPFMNRLDQSPDGKCHQVAAFQRILDLSKDPQIKALVATDTKRSMMMSVATTYVQGLVDPITSSLLSALLMKSFSSFNLTQNVQANSHDLKADKAAMDHCATVLPVNNQAIDCLMVQGMEMADKMMSNQTLIDQMTKGNATKASQFMEMQKTVKTVLGPKIDAVKADSKAMDFCTSSINPKCIADQGAAKILDLNKDDAAVSAHFQGNATLITRFKDMAARADGMLQKHKSDEALQAVCQQMPNVSPIDINAITLEDVPKGKKTTTARR